MVPWSAGSVREYLGGIMESLWWGTSTWSTAINLVPSTNATVGHAEWADLEEERTDSDPRSWLQSRTGVSFCQACSSRHGSACFGDTQFEVTRPRATIAWPGSDEERLSSIGLFIRNQNDSHLRTGHTNKQRSEESERICQYMVDWWFGWRGGGPSRNGVGNAWTRHTERDVFPRGKRRSLQSSVSLNQRNEHLGNYLVWNFIDWHNALFRFVHGCRVAKSSAWSSDTVKRTGYPSF